MILKSYILTLYSRFIQVLTWMFLCIRGITQIHSADMLCNQLIQVGGCTASTDRIQWDVANLKPENWPSTATTRAAAAATTTTTALDVIVNVMYAANAGCQLKMCLSIRISYWDRDKQGHFSNIYTTLTLMGHAVNWPTPKNGPKKRHLKKNLKRMAIHPADTHWVTQSSHLPGHCTLGCP